jgi:hypothetical protein
VGREGMIGGPGPGKENGFNSNLKLIFQIYSKFLRSKQDLPKLGKFKIKYGWKLFKVRNNFLRKTYLDSKWILN